ncbi:folylpolyglutamate synthase/dihydrofolate synthase family protein [Leucobacter soli]|uniref:hypothetical protein n=1 Tax=Leucobacter soli TaxID=2812850 RepID=UPI0036235C4C
MTGAERAAQRVYDALLTRVGEAHPRPRIEPVRRLAELAGTPQLSYPVIQIAGTNGKTSTSRAIDALLRAHGLRTGLFSSPHLVSFTERFQIDGEPVGGNALADAWEELQLPCRSSTPSLPSTARGRSPSSKRSPCSPSRSSPTRPSTSRWSRSAWAGSGTRRT